MTLDRYTVERQLTEAMAEDRWDDVTRLAPVLDRLDTAPRPATLLGAALWYAERGLHVFPLSPHTKLPVAGSAGCKDATADPDLITAWWSAHPMSNIGLATGHVVDVVDFDGAMGHEAWGRVFPEPGIGLVPGLPLLATVSTPRPGGLHAYVPATTEGNRARMAPGVDYRGRGGYVVAPPSHLDDRPGQTPGTYRFLRPLQPGMTPW